MVKKILVTFSFILPFAATGQNIKEVMFSEPAYDERYFKSKLMVPVFRYVSPVIEEYEQFGAPIKKGLDKFTIKKLPDMSGCKDTAYGFIYYGGYPAAINRGYITFIIGNYRRWFDPAHIYADKNNNLDFSDDGPPVIMDLSLQHIDINFPNPAAANAAYTVRLGRFSLDNDYRYRALMDEYYKKNQGNKEFIGIDYSFKENRLNMRGATYASETDTFRLALYDGNYDGLYNNAEFDYIYVGKKGDSIFLDDFRFNFQDGLKNAEFEWNFKVYRITEIDPAGRFIKFYLDKNAMSKRALQLGKKIPSFTFYQYDAKKELKIKNYKKKGLYIYFYNIQSPTFEQDTAALRILHQQYGNCINVLTLNYGDYYKTLMVIKERDSIPYIMGLSNRKINRMFNIERLPAGYLCRKKLKLSHINITPREVLELLEKGKK